ncbi:hypothetical protein FOPG_05884 [Fusarium oxysporum f. sp. conglutinans race 2 54008]|uniref:Uncharacterized protein n=2 Tax=Fusarium oxysporum TaxID=5507 RepID=X0LRZ8_FUSOX|nr:hypothetical protein FOPG_05884 [Fusarium oxysporum f. sp. conglutinans race 2 54008]EXM28693.1 hypothetical protein FOTG_05873 [Fusarium oxysporum f. sp. vasinfectum 25433]
MTGEGVDATVCVGARLNVTWDLRHQAQSTVWDFKDSSGIATCNRFPSLESLLLCSVMRWILSHPSSLSLATRPSSKPTIIVAEYLEAAGCRENHRAECFGGT